MLLMWSRSLYNSVPARTIEFSHLSYKPSPRKCERPKDLDQRDCSLLSRWLVCCYWADWL